ncbi:C-X-C chemokine receptor type 3-like [Discoglossus pictus]
MDEVCRPPVINWVIKGNQATIGPGQPRTERVSKGLVPYDYDTTALEMPGSVWAYSTLELGNHSLGAKAATVTALRVLENLEDNHLDNGIQVMGSSITNIDRLRGIYFLEHSLNDGSIRGHLMETVTKLCAGGGEVMQFFFPVLQLELQESQDAYSYYKEELKQRISLVNMVDISADMTHMIIYDGDFDKLFENSSHFSDYSSPSDNSAFQPCSQEETKAFDGHFFPPFYSLLCLFGMLGNMLVVVVLMRNKRSLQSTEIFIMHLTLADILLVVTLPFWAVQAVSGWVFGDVLCKIMASVFKINFYAGIFLLTCISCDRYLSIVFAVQVYKKHRSHVVHWSCLLVWGLSVALSIPDIMFSQVVHEYRTNTTQCQLNFHPSNSKSWRIAMSFTYNVLGFLLPLCSMVYCYTHIIVTLLRSQGFKKHRALRVIIAVVVAFFLCWAPHNITALLDALVMLKILQISCAMERRIDIALSVTSGLCYFHCCLNPILYAFIGVKFKNKFIELMSQVGCLRSYIIEHFKKPPAKSSTWSESGDTSQSMI